MTRGRTEVTAKAQDLSRKEAIQSIHLSSETDYFRDHFTVCVHKATDTKYTNITLNNDFLSHTQNYLIIQITEVQHAIDQLKRKLDTDKMKLILEVKVIYICANQIVTVILK